MDDSNESNLKKRKSDEEASNTLTILDRFPKDIIGVLYDKTNPKCTIELVNRGSKDLFSSYTITIAMEDFFEMELEFHIDPDGRHAIELLYDYYAPQNAYIGRDAYKMSDLKIFLHTLDCNNGHIFKLLKIDGSFLHVLQTECVTKFNVNKFDESYGLFLKDCKMLIQKLMNHLENLK